ncbi:MAG: diguanylate cyclase [bacterium]
MDDILNKFIQSLEWKTIKDTIEKKFGIPPFMVVDKERKPVEIYEKDRVFCRMIKEKEEGRRLCSQSFVSISNNVLLSRQPTVFSCQAEFLGYIIPLLSRGELVGMIYGCQLVDAGKDLHYYEQVSAKLHLDTKAFLYTLKAIPTVTIGGLETDVSLIFQLANASINLLAERVKYTGKEGEIASITRFYELFEKSRYLLLTLEPSKLYSLIVNLAAKAMDAEICSLMILDPTTDGLSIKASVGLEEAITKRTFKKGAGIVGYVCKTGEPLLVKDITEDPRFNIEKSQPKYYTKSLISAPLRVGDEIFGILNVNNKSSRAPFNETDLKMISIIAGHAAIAIKNAKEIKEYSEEKEKVVKEIAKDQETKEKIVVEKQALIQSKEDLENKLREKEEFLKIKMELLEEKEKHIKDKTELERERQKLNEAINSLIKERDELKTKIKESEKLIIEKEELEKRLEETIKEKEELAAQTEELGILYSISTEAPKMSKPREILSWILERIQPFFNYHASAYLYLDEERLIGEIKQTCFISDHCIKSIEENMESFWKKNNPEQSAKKPEFFTEKGTKEELFWVGLKEFQNELILPILYGDKTKGLLSIHSFNKEPFPPLKRRLLRIISHQVSETLERVELFAKIKEMAEKDELTKTYNYRYLEDYLLKEFSYAESYKKPLGLIMIDFDKLKYINDTFGHAEGNRLITTISDIIKKTMNGKGLIARFGGDEFAVVLPETLQNVAYDYAEKIRKNIESTPMTFGGKPHKATASLGVAVYPNPGIETSKDIFAKADKCLYAAKEAGRNKVVLYQP